MAETNKKQRPIAIPETRGIFAVSGYVSGVLSNRFYSESVSQDGRKRRNLLFAIQVNPDNKVYVELSAFPSDRVYFSKTVEENGKRSTAVESVKWDDRRNPSVVKSLESEGYRMMGITVGVERKIDMRGVESNDVLHLAPYDAAEYLSSHLRDDMPVFVRGNIRYSFYNGRRYRRFEIAQVSYSREVELAQSSPDTNPNRNDFHQQFVFMGISEDPSNRARHIVSAKVIGYNTVEDTEFVLENRDIAANIKRVVKPYTMLEVDGYIQTRRDSEESAPQNCWGVPNRMSVRRSPTVTEMVICAVYPEQMDNQVYNENSVSEAIAAAQANRQARSDYGERHDTKAYGAPAKASAPFSLDDEDGWED